MKQEREPQAERIGLAILQQLRDEPAHVSSVMAQAFRAFGRVPPEVKALVADRVYGIVRSQRLLDHIIDRLATAPVRGRSRDLARWLAHALLDGALAPPAAQRRFPRLDWCRVVAIEREVDDLPEDQARLALQESLPDWLAALWIREFGPAEAFALARSLNQPAPQTIRANTLHIDRDTLASRLRDRGLEVVPTRRATQGLIVASRTELFRLPEFRSGLFEVQDEGSQLVSELVAPPPGGTILDACAGTGGKTLHLGALLRSRGQVYAVGVGAPGQRRLRELRRRARRAGLHNVRFISIAAEAGPTPGELPGGGDVESDISRGLSPHIGRIDRVLVDAPCSGLGVLRRNPEVRWRLQADDVARLAELQRAILERFAPCVRMGGRLIYATCSLLREENEDVVDAFLRAHAEFSLVEAKEILGSKRAHAIGDGRVLRLLPHRHGTDGFFSAVLRRQRGSRPPGSSP